MSIQELETIRAEVCRRALVETNESRLEEALAIFTPKSIPGLAYTKEERIAAAMQGLEEYKQGLGVTTEELRKRTEAW